MNQTTKTFIYITLGMGVLVLLANKLFGAKATKNPYNSGRNLVVGDSHGVMIGAKIKNGKADPLLSKSGWNVSNVINALNTYPISIDVSNIFISIGTNGQYNKNDKIEELVSLLQQKFPNAYLYAFKGSYGWSSSGNEAASKNQAPYYERFANMGVTILNNGLGYFSTDAGAHSTSSSQAKAIINEINSYTSN